MAFYRSRHFQIPRFPRWDFRIYATGKGGSLSWGGNWTVHLLPGIRVTGEGHREAFHLQAGWGVWEVGLNAWAKDPWWLGRHS